MYEEDEDSDLGEIQRRDQTGSILSSPAISNYIWEKNNFFEVIASHQYKLGLQINQKTSIALMTNVN